MEPQSQRACLPASLSVWTSFRARRGNGPSSLSKFVRELDKEKDFPSSLATKMDIVVAARGRLSRILSISNKGGGEGRSNMPKSLGLRAASAVHKPRVRKQFSSTNVCSMVLVFVTWTYYFLIVSAQSNFSLQSTGYSCSSNLLCFGDAHVYNGDYGNGIQAGRLSLIREANSTEATHRVGLAYYNKPVQLLDSSTGKSGSFVTNFTIDQVWGVYLGNESNGVTNVSYLRGDGMAFVISASGSNSSLGTTSQGSYLGIFDDYAITTFKSIVVEFDTFQNDYPPIYDISDSHVSFDFMNITYAAAANTSKEDVDLASNATLYVWVEYSNETKQLEVRVSNVDFKPSVPLLNYTLDLSDVVEEYMWVGFSSASGSDYSNFYIGDWTFESYGFISNPIILPPSPKSGGSKLGLIVGISVGISAFLLACILGALYLRRKSWRRSPPAEDPMIKILEGMPERFSYKQLSVATKAFSEDSKLGRGGFGAVYRGVLPGSGAQVAVKKINSESSQGEKEFMAEVSIISQLRHRNLIQLQGWCKDALRGKYLLVYELMPNGSLDKVLFGPTESQPECLPWAKRFNIVTGTAAAVDYLHQGWKQQVIHRDIKSSNIMLDAEWNAKLGDFGLARLVDHQREAATTLMAGTYGYIAPEVAASGRFTDKTDVFAFGAVALEVACGRRALSASAPDDEMILVDWVWHRLSEGDLMSTVDKRLGYDYDPYWMEVVLSVGLLCSHPNPLDRPSMRHVVQVLAGDIPVPALPATKPAPAVSSGRRKSFRSPKFADSVTPTSRSGSLSLASTDKADSNFSGSSPMEVV